MAAKEKQSVLNPNVDITNERIINLRDYINTTFNAFDSEGNLDLDKMQRNVAYSIGNIYTDFSGLLMQERFKLAEVEDALKAVKATALLEIKKNQQFQLNYKEIDIVLAAHHDVREKQLEFDKQSAYVDFLDRAVKQIGYYANGVRTIFQREEIKNGGY